MQRHWIFRLIRSYLATASFQQNWSSSQVQTTGSISCAAGIVLEAGTRLRGSFCAAWRGTSLRERIETGSFSGVAEPRGCCENYCSAGGRSVPRGKLSDEDVAFPVRFCMTAN